MTLHENLREMERSRERYWRRCSSTSPVKLRWRALTLRHCLHVLPGESILEIGAGSGLWTERLSRVFRGENEITAAVFNDDLFEAASRRRLPGVRFIRVEDLERDLPHEGFDYVIGTSILCHNQYVQNLHAIHQLLKPGGGLFFFEANYWNPQVFLKSVVPSLGRLAGHASSQVGMRRYQLMRIASHQGFASLEIVPFDILHPRMPRSWIPAVQAIAFVFEHTPVLRETCGTLYIWGRKPGAEDAVRPTVDLARHEHLFGSTSIVVPCHNEEQNIPGLVEALERFYGAYIHEIILVDDNSTDDTAAVARELTSRNPRVKLVERRPPNGVGLALRAGYRAASGRYILSMDCDFVNIVPELRDLFDVVAAGHDGAIGSRFSHESLLVNYPFLKIVSNRAFHLLVRLFLLGGIRDLSNNLKLYRAEIFKELEIEERNFAANVETGLKPLLAGYDIQEVPISWINRTVDMGSSSFKIAGAAPGYTLALLRAVSRAWKSRRKLRGMHRGTAAVERSSGSVPMEATLRLRPLSDAGQIAAAAQLKPLSKSSLSSSGRAKSLSESSRSKPLF
jgi:dolichol-phosphate mannosyltransferase